MLSQLYLQEKPRNSFENITFEHTQGGPRKPPNTGVELIVNADGLKSLKICTPELLS